MPSQPPENHPQDTPPAREGSADFLDEEEIAGPWREDPIMRRCRREAILILSVWFLCFAWSATYCYLNGYLSHEPRPASKVTGPDIAKVVGPLKSFDRKPDSLTFPLGLGIPDWVFYGIVMPWVFCVVFSLVFCQFIFAEDDLRGDAETEES